MTDNEQKHKKLTDKIWETVRVDTALPPEGEKSDVLQSIADIVVKAMNSHKFPTLYRYSIANCDNICPLLHESLYLPTADRMNDDLEGLIENPDGDSNAKKQLKTRLSEFQKRTLIKSFSVLEADSYMWKEYGDNHKGICVTYNFSSLLTDSISTDKDNELIKHLYPVQYSEAFFKCKYPANLNNNIYFYLRKRKEGEIKGRIYPFESEKEWRLVYVLEHIPNSSDPEHKKSVKNCITEVCFGAEICPVRREQIIEKICSHHLNVRLFQAHKVGNLIEREEIPLPKSGR